MCIYLWIFNLQICEDIYVYVYVYVYISTGDIKSEKYLFLTYKDRD